MTELRMFNHNAFRWLLDNIQDNKEHYKDPNADFGKILNDSIGEYSEPTDITINGDIRLKPPEADSTSKRHQADDQALDFYNSLEGMTPRLATEPKILAYINHMYLHGYGILPLAPQEKQHFRCQRPAALAHYVKPEIIHMQGKHFRQDVVDGPHGHKGGRCVKRRL